MIEKKNEPLKNHTTFRIGGPAEKFYLPDNERELIGVIKYCINKGIKYRILGRGSNLLVNDKGVKGAVIKNTEACLSLKRKDNLVEVGSSVSLQKIVRFCVDNELEGMEYLYSIPATVGGAIYMNAGRGKKHNIAISDNIVSVKIFDGNETRYLSKVDCSFAYRKSIFHDKNDWIILGAEFKLKNQKRDVGEEKIKERMEFVKNSQNRKYPNAGSIFIKRSFIASRLLNGMKIGDAKMKGNWISNLDNASYKDVVWLIKISKILSYLTLIKPELEIEIWE